MYTAAVKKKNITAKIATNTGACAFCGREVDEETNYGKLYEIGDIHCHYFCTLLSCCLIQKGRDEDGLFGFLYADILAEVARSKKHKCSYCGCDGASLGCAVSSCKKQFHLPCGREKKAVSLFYGNYKSFCSKHAPKQKISDAIMDKVKVRLARKKTENLYKAPNTIKEGIDDNVTEGLSCVICYEAVEGYPSVDTFWPPCCGRDAWYHRTCLERMCLSAGVHYLKCPLCNDRDKFREAVVQQGYYVPDRDAAWELEQNAFSEIYNTSYSCGADACLCPGGRGHDTESGPWDINLCVLCGSAGAHARCRFAVESPGDGVEHAGEAKPYVCPTCSPSAASAPNLVQALHELALQEQSAAPERVLRPLMPSRMSLRRTKRRPAPASSSNDVASVETKIEASNTEMSRLELNLKTPKRSAPDTEVIKMADSKLMSPIKQLGLGDISSLVHLQDSDVISRIREKLKVPKPLAVKRKIVLAILEDLMNTSYKDKIKTKEPLKEWLSPKKCVEAKQEVQAIEQENNQTDTLIDNNRTNTSYVNNQETETQVDEKILESPKLKTVDIEKDSSMEISNNNDTVSVDVVTREDSGETSPLKISFLKLSPNNKDKSNKVNVDIDLESFKMQYLSETSQSSACKRKIMDIDNKNDTAYKAESKRRKRSKQKKKIKIKLKFQESSESEKIILKKDKHSPIESSKPNEKNDIKIKLKFNDQNFEVKNEEYISRKNKKIKKRKLNKKEHKKENFKIKLKLKKENFYLKREGVDVRKDKLKKKKSSKKGKRKEKERGGEIEKKEKIELKESPKILKQYLLTFSNENHRTIVRPDDANDVTMKRKYVKKEKLADNFKQMSLDNFFSFNVSPKSDDKN